MKTFLPSTTVAQPTGVLNATNADAVRQELLAALSAEQCGGVVVDLSRVESMDSAGLIALAASLRAAQTAGKFLQLRQVPPSIRIVFELTQLDAAFGLTHETGMAMAA